MKKILWIVLTICVGFFVWWYVEEKVGMTIENGYSASEIKGVVMGIAGVILLPIALVYELLRKIKDRKH